MTKIYLKIAGFNIQINFGKTKWPFIFNKLKKEILFYHQGFVVKKPKKTDYLINIVEESTVLIHQKLPGQYFINFYNKAKKREVVIFYQISLYQFQMILREILVELLGENQGFIIHGSAVEKRGEGLIFTGRPGAGKSTAMSLLDPKFTGLGDDTVIIRKENGRYFLYQTPFIEKNDWLKKTKDRFLVKAIFFLKKSREFKTVKLTDKQEVLTKIISQFWSLKKSYKRQLKYLFDFVESFQGFYYLYFAKNKDKLRELLKNFS